MSFFGTVCGQGMHLLISQVGEGASISNEKGIEEAVERASFLALGRRIKVFSKSGLETMSAGYQFRFGSDTEFNLSEKAIHLHEGSIMIQSRKIGNKVVVNGPEVLLRLSGVGTCMLEVEANGGVKIIGLLGRIMMGVGEELNEIDLLAGELANVKPGNKGFGEKISINLSKLMETSFLLSGFNNSPSFQNSLSSIAKAQQDSIDQSDAAEEGNANESDTLAKNNESLLGSNKNSSGLIRTFYRIPEIDPLQELLGRTPIRLVPNNTEEKVSTPIEPRPLPGTLLRLKN